MPGHPACRQPLWGHGDGPRRCTHGCPFPQDHELETCRVAPPDTWVLCKRGQHGDSTGSLSPVPLGKHHGAVNPCRLPPCARAPFGAGGRQLQLAERRGTEGLCGRGSQKAGSGTRGLEVLHNGVGNENFALGFPRAHPIDEEEKGRPSPRPLPNGRRQGGFLHSGRQVQGGKKGKKKVPPPSSPPAR